jgi:hypothetical protein
MSSTTTEGDTKAAEEVAGADMMMDINQGAAEEVAGAMMVVGEGEAATGASQGRQIGAVTGAEEGGSTTMAGTMRIEEAGAAAIMMMGAAEGAAEADTTLAGVSC